MKDISILGIDLAKTIFHIVALDAEGNKTLAKKLHRDQFSDYILSNIPTSTLIRHLDAEYMTASLLYQHTTFIVDSTYSSIYDEKVDPTPSYRRRLDDAF